MKNSNSELNIDTDTNIDANTIIDCNSNYYDYTLLKNDIDINRLASNEVTSDFNWFIEAFFEKNPTATEDDLWNILRKKKRIWYINFKDLENSGFVIPNKLNCGEFLIRRSKVTMHEPVGNICLLKGKRKKVKRYKLYDSIHATGIGVVPINGERYAVLCRKKTTMFSIIFPIIFIRLLIFSLFNI